MGQLLLLDDTTNNFKDVISQSLRLGAEIKRDLTHANPWEFMGTFFTFAYEAETKRTYDRYPLVMYSYYDPTTNILTGHNFHHLPIPKRLWLLESMFGIMKKMNPGMKKSDKTEIKPEYSSAEQIEAIKRVMSWGELGQYFAACTRRYKLSNLRSELYVINAANSTLIQDLATIPYERYLHGTPKEMMEKSRKIYMREINRR